MSFEATKRRNGNFKPSQKVFSSLNLSSLNAQRERPMLRLILIGYTNIFSAYLVEKNVKIVIYTFILVWLFY